MIWPFTCDDWYPFLCLNPPIVPSKFEFIISGARSYLNEVWYGSDGEFIGFETVAIWPSAPFRADINWRPVCEVFSNWIVYCLTIILPWSKLLPFLIWSL